MQNFDCLFVKSPTEIGAVKLAKNLYTCLLRDSLKAFYILRQLSEEFYSHDASFFQTDHHRWRRSNGIPSAINEAIEASGNYVNEHGMK